MRLLIACGLGLPVTFALFLFMANLIQMNNTLSKSFDGENFIEFIRSVPNDQLQARRRSLPKKPPPASETPQMPKLAIKQDATAQTTKLAMDMPLLAAPLSLGDGPYLGGGTAAAGGAGGDGNVIPLVRVAPQFPRKAAMAGKEGWVQLSFDITAEGTVANVQLLNSKPRRLFDQAATRALYKWKYRPKIFKGKAVAQNNLQVQIDFKLQR